MPYEWKVKLPTSSLPFLARVELDQWLEVKFDLDVTAVIAEPKPWTKEDDMDTVYTTMFTHKEGWVKDTEIPFWMVDLWNDFCKEFASPEGKLDCRFKRSQRPNPDGKLDRDGKPRMDNFAILETVQ